MKSPLQTFEFFLPLEKSIFLYYPKAKYRAQINTRRNVMKEFVQVQNEIGTLVNKWESRLSGIEADILDNRKNTQNRTIKQILGHLIDSASNNLHRTIHLQ